MDVYADLVALVNYVDAMFALAEESQEADELDAPYVLCVDVRMISPPPAAACADCAQAFRPGEDEDVYCCGVCLRSLGEESVKCYHIQCWAKLAVPTCAQCGGHMVA